MSHKVHQDTGGKDRFNYYEPCFEGNAENNCTGLPLVYVVKDNKTVKIEGFKTFELFRFFEKQKQNPDLH